MRLGIHEERTRIWIHLPYNKPAEARAVSRIIDYLKNKRTARPGTGRITGFTQSRSLPAPFEGWWWSGKRKKWVYDILVLIFVDHEFRINDPQLVPEIEKIKADIKQIYDEEGAHQEEIWIVTHPIWKYD